MMWNWRLLPDEGEARYADWMETALYNAMLSGVSLDGRDLLLPEPARRRGRPPPPALVRHRLLPPEHRPHAASLPGYLYSTSGRGGVGAPLRRGEVEVAVPGGAGGQRSRVARRATPGGGGGA